MMARLLAIVRICIDRLKAANDRERLKELRRVLLALAEETKIAPEASGTTEPVPVKSEFNCGTGGGERIFRSTRGLS